MPGLSVVVLTLAAMELKVLAAYVGLLAEVTFAACFLGNEVMRYVLRGRITRFEQFAHSIPEHRYLSHFSAPLNNVLASAGAGAGAGMVFSSHAGVSGPYLGVLVFLATMMAFGWYSLRHAAGITPRPVSRARLRRLLAEADRRLATGMPRPSLAEVVRMRGTLTRILHVGDRLAGQALSWRWRDAIGRERRVLTVAVSIAVLVPFAVGSLATVRVVHGDDRTLPVLGAALLLIAANLTGVLLRGRRCRDEQYDLGVELRRNSAGLLARLETIAEPASTTARATQVISTIEAFARRWLRNGRPGLASAGPAGLPSTLGSSKAP